MRERTPPEHASFGRKVCPESASSGAPTWAVATRPDSHGATPTRSTPEAREVAPVVSDATAPALIGCSPRAFRAWVQAHHVPHLVIARRTVVLLSTLTEMVARGAAPPPRESGELPREDVPVTADEMLQRLGFEDTDS